MIWIHHKYSYFIITYSINFLKKKLLVKYIKNLTKEMIVCQIMPILLIRTSEKTKNKYIDDLKLIFTYD